MLQVQELVLEFICSRTTVQELHQSKNYSSRTSSVQEPQFKNFVRSRPTVQELHRFMNLSSLSSRTFLGVHKQFKN